MWALRLGSVILFLLILYNYLIYPIISIVNESIIFPIIKYSFPGYSISINTDNFLSIIISSESIEKEVWIRFPFGPHYIIPSAFLVYNKKYFLLKILTYYRIVIFFMALLMLSPDIIFLYNYIPNGPFYGLTKSIGLVFMLLAIRENAKLKQ